MNYLLKTSKNHKKTSSYINSKSKKKKSSSRMIIKQNLINIRENLISNSIKKKNFAKCKHLLGIKNIIKSNNISDCKNNTRDSIRKIINNKQNKFEESKGDFNTYFNNSKKNLTSTSLNNESSLNNTNAYIRTTLLSSSTCLNNNSNIINNDNLKKSNYNNNTNNYKKKSIYKQKKSLEFISVCKSKSNKEIKNKKNDFQYFNDTTKRNDITQRCRHKQVKREIYINNIININKNNRLEINKKNNNDIILNTVRKIKNNILNFDDTSPELKKYRNKLFIEKQENNKNSSIPITNINKNILGYNTKKQNLLELYDNKNKIYKKINNINEDINADLKKNNDNNNINKYYKKKNIGYLKTMTINSKKRNNKSPYLNYNYTNSENNIKNINNNELCKAKNKQFKSKDKINQCKRVNSINIKQNNLKNDVTYNNINNNILDNINKKQYKKSKNQNRNYNISDHIIIRSYNFIHNTEKKKKENDIYFDEIELDENTLSVSNGKFMDNKKCQTMINRVFHFETGSNEIFNNFRTNININDINKMSFINKNQSTKNMNNKNNSSNTIINANFNSNFKGNNSSNEARMQKINVIIKNNMKYNTNKKSLIKNENLLKKCYTDVLIDSNNKNDAPKCDNNNEMIYYKENENKEDNKINKDFNSSESSTTSFRVDKNYITNHSLNLNLYKKISYINYKKKRNFYTIFQCQKFTKILFTFCDINLLNKICLLSKQIYKFMKPLIYSKISYKIYNSNKIDKNIKIKIYLMEKYSPLSKLSPALIKKKYTDLKFENNHKYDTEIKKDLTRTFPDNILFKYGNSYYNKLYHVLTAYSNYNNNIGYTQGLNFLAANIIYLFEDEIDEFIFLDALIHKFDLDKILSKSNSNYFIKKLTDINNFIIHKLPKLSKYLSDIKLNYEYFTTNWILTLFSNSMETEYLYYIWDYMIIFGWKFFECFVVAVLMNFESDILNSNQNNITFIMKNMLKNNRFNTDFKNIILKTLQMLIKEK